MNVFDRIEIWSGFLLPVDLNLDLFRSVFSPWLTGRPTRPTVLDVTHELDPARILGRFVFSPGANGRSDLDSCTIYIIPADEPQEMISAFFVLDDFYAGKVIVSYKEAFYANSKEGHFRIDTADMGQANDLGVEESDIRSADSRGPTSASRSATEGKPPRLVPTALSSSGQPFRPNEAEEIKFEFEYDSLVQSLTRLVTSFSTTEKVYKDFNKLLVTFTRNELIQIEDRLNFDGNALKQARALSGSQPLENKIKLNMIEYSQSLAQTLDQLPVPYSYLTPDFSKNPDYVSRDVDDDDDDDGRVNVKTDIKTMPREMSTLLSNYVFDALNARIDSGSTLGKIMGDENLSSQMVAIAERIKGIAEKSRRVPKQTQTKKRKAPDMLDRLEKRVKLNDVDRIQDAPIVDASTLTVPQLIAEVVTKINDTGFAIVRNYVDFEKVAGWRQQAASEFTNLLGQIEWTAVFGTMKDFNNGNPTWETRQLPCLAYMKVWQAVKRDERVKLLLKSVIEALKSKPKQKSGASASPSTEKMDVSSSSESSQSKPAQKETLSTDKELLYGIDCPWFASSATAKYEASKINDNQALDLGYLRKYIHSAPVPAESSSIQSYMILARDLEFDTWLNNPGIVTEPVEASRTGAMYFFKRGSKTRDLAEGWVLRDASVPADLKKSSKENLEQTKYGLTHGDFQEEDRHMCYEYRTRVGDIVLMAPSTRRRHTFNFPAGASTSDAVSSLKMPFILAAPLSARLGAVKKTQHPLVTDAIFSKRLLPYAADRPLISVRDEGKATLNSELSNRVDVREAAMLYLGKPYKNPTQLAADKLKD